MNSLKKLLPSLAVLMTLSNSVLAHPGHDHSHWTSPMMHTAFGLSILLAVGLLVWKFRAQSKKSVEE